MKNPFLVSRASSPRHGKVGFIRLAGAFVLASFVAIAVFGTRVQTPEEIAASAAKAEKQNAEKQNAIESTKAPTTSKVVSASKPVSTVAPEEQAHAEAPQSSCTTAVHNHFGKDAHVQQPWFDVDITIADSQNGNAFGEQALNTWSVYGTKGSDAGQFFCEGKDWLNLSVAFKPSPA